MEELRVAIVQHGSLRNPRESLERAKKLRVPSSADLVVFPEYSMFDPTGLDPGTIYRLAEEWLEEWSSFYERLAVETGAYVLGHVFEPSGDGRRVYNTARLYTPSGGLASFYRKTHLFDAYGYKESLFTRPGESLASPVEAKGFRLGVAICFEIRYPEIFRYYALRGADAVLVPAAWYRGPLKEETLFFLARSRAHENTMYIVVAVNYNENFTGRSMAVDPYGVVAVEAGIGVRVVEAVLDKNVIREARKTLPLLELRRPGLYAGLDA